MSTQMNDLRRRLAEMAEQVAAGENEPHAVAPIRPTVKQVNFIKYTGAYVEQEMQDNLAALNTQNDITVAFEAAKARGVAIHEEASAGGHPVAVPKHSRDGKLLNRTSPVSPDWVDFMQKWGVDMSGCTPSAAYPNALLNRPAAEDASFAGGTSVYNVIRIATTETTATTDKRRMVHLLRGPMSKKDWCVLEPTFNPSAKIELRRMRERGWIHTVGSGLKFAKWALTDEGRKVAEEAKGKWGG